MLQQPSNFLADEYYNLRKLRLTKIKISEIFTAKIFHNMKKVYKILLLGRVGAIFLWAIFLEGNFSVGCNFLGGLFPGGNFPGGTFPRGIFPGGIFLGSIFPGTVRIIPIIWLYNHETKSDNRRIKCKK